MEQWRNKHLTVHLYICVVVLQRKRAAVAAEREAAFQQLCSDVLGALEPGSGVLSEATQVLEYAEAAQQARKVALHQQWHTQVFEPIQVSRCIGWWSRRCSSSSTVGVVVSSSSMAEFG